MPCYAARSKYGAQPTEVEGIRFHSKREAYRYRELRLLEKAGEIKDLELQPRFPLMVPGRGHRGPYSVHVADYVADFRYRAGPQGILTVEDVKGVRTAVYKLKKKMVEAQYGITVVEVY